MFFESKTTNKSRVDSARKVFDFEHEDDAVRDCGNAQSLPILDFGMERSLG